MAPRRTTYAGGLVRAINIPRVDTPQYKEQAQFYSDLNSRLDTIKDFAIARGTEEAEASAEAFAYSDENPATIDAFLSPTLSSEQKQEIMGDRFGNAYERKLYETNQSTLKTQYANLGKILLDEEYNESLATDKPLESFYNNANGQIDGMLEPLLEVSPILYGELRSDLRGKLYDKYLSLGQKQNELIKATNTANLKSSILDTEADLSPLLTGQANTLDELRNLFSTETRASAALTDLSGPQTDKLIQDGLAKINTRMQDLVNSAVALAYEGDASRDDVALALATGDWSAFVDTENPYATNNLIYQAANKILTSASPTERSDIIAKAGTFIENSFKAQEAILNIEKKNKDTSILKLQKFLHPGNLKLYFKDPENPERVLSQGEIVGGVGVINIGGVAYTYREAVEQFQVLDSVKADEFFKNTSITTYTTPGVADWLTTKLNIASKNTYVPDTLINSLYDNVVANGGELTKENWDNITKGTLGEFDESFGSSVFLGTDTQGSLITTIDNYQDEFYKEIETELARLTQDAEIIAMIKKELPFSPDEGLFAGLDTTTRYSEILEKDKGEIFVKVMSAVDALRAQAESGEIVLTKKQMLDQVLPTLYQSEISNAKRYRQGLINDSFAAYEFKDTFASTTSTGMDVRINPNSVGPINRDVTRVEQQYGVPQIIFKGGFAENIKEDVYVPFDIYNDDVNLALKSAKQIMLYIDKATAAIGGAGVMHQDKILQVGGGLPNFKGDLQAYIDILEFQQEFEQTQRSKLTLDNMLVGE